MYLAYFTPFYLYFYLKIVYYYEFITSVIIPSFCYISSFSPHYKNKQKFCRNAVNMKCFK